MVWAAIAAWPSALLAQAPARDTPAATGTAVIRGRVMVAGADRPLSRVEVHAVCAPLRVNKAVLTDGNGRCEIAELPAGRYTVAFSRANYVRASFGQRRPLGPGATIEIANGQIVTQVDAALQAAGVVTGRILDEFGDPLTNVQVQPMRYQFINGERRVQTAAGGGMTNDLGEYRIYGLTPGQYFVSATYRANNGPNDTSDRTGYAPTYYPGTGSIAEAQRLTVTSGQTIGDINMTLLPVVAVRVSGVALDSQGRPMAGAGVNMLRRVGTSVIFAGSTFAAVRPDGTFTIGGTTPGDYSLRVSRPGTQDESATADVTVTTADVTDVQLVVVKPSTLRGRVVFEAGAAKPPAMSTLRVSVSHPDSASGVSGNDTPKDDGAFEMKASAGHALMRVTGSGNWRLKRVLTADGADITDGGFDISASANIEGFLVEMTTGYPELTGTVVDAAGAAVHDCIVVVFAQDPLRWSALTRYVAASRPDQDEVFHLRLPAGEYNAVAFEMDDPSASVTDPDILQQLRDRATKLTLGDAEKKTLALTLSEPPVF